MNSTEEVSSVIKHEERNGNIVSSPNENVLDNNCNIYTDDSDSDDDYIMDESLMETSDDDDEVNKKETIHVKRPSSSLCLHFCTFEGCGMQFGRPYRLKQHERTHTKEKPYSCDFEDCDKCYARPQHLKRHQEVTHYIRPPSTPLKCEQCGKLMSNSYSLKKHEVQYHKKQKYSCTDCGKAFMKQQHLLTHSFQHTGIKPFVCDYPDCNKSFTIPSKLTRHEESHTKNRYQCPRHECVELFNFYKDMQNHVFDAHPKECDVCGQRFRQLRRLRLHRETHENVREVHYCTFQDCWRSYYELKNLIIHVKDAHHGKSRFQCEECCRYLCTKQKLKNHMKIHSPDYIKTVPNKKKSRKPRKDKGKTKRNIANLLSGYAKDSIDASNLDALKITDSEDDDISSGEEEIKTTNSDCGHEDLQQTKLSNSKMPYHHIKEILFSTSSF